MARKGNLLLDVVKGAVAGAVATWVMGRVTTGLHEVESDEAKKREKDALGGKTAYGVAAEKGAAAVGLRLDAHQRKTAGMALHYGLGIAAGAVYGGLRGRLIGSDWKSSLEFGSAFFLLVDELANPVLGLTPGPGAFPWQSHARGLAGHTVFGVATEGTLRALDRVG